MIEIRKYEYADIDHRNYFDSPTFIDSIQFTKILSGGTPGYTESFEKQFESFSFQAADFDLKFSLGQGETSLLGKSIEQFFTESIDNHCLIASISLDRTIGGEIDIETIVIDKSYSDGHYDISFTVFGLERTLADAANKTPFIPSAGISPAFSFFLNNSFFWDGPKSYVNFDTSALDWGNKPIGSEPYIVQELWSQIIGNSDLSDTTIWGLFKDLLIFWGIIYRVELNGSNLNYFHVTIYLKFRNTLNETVTVQSQTLNYGNVINKIKADWQYFKIAKVRSSTTQHFGILSNGLNSAGNRFYARGIKVSAFSQQYIELAYEQDDKLWINDQEHYPSNGFTVPLAKVNITEFSKYFDCAFAEGDHYRQWTFSFLHQEIDLDPIFSRKDYSFPAIWTRFGYTLADYGLGSPRWKLIQHPDNVYAIMFLAWQQMIEQYKFLYSQFIYRVYRLKLSLVSGFIYKLFMKTTIDGRNLILYKLNNLDYFDQRQVESVWYEDIS